jgi:hypothetical protein
MARGTVDGVVFARPAHRRQEFSNDEAVGRLLDVLAERPPAKVVDLLDLLIGAVQQGDVAGEKRPGRTVRDRLRVELLVAPIELIDVMLECAGLQHVRALCGIAGRLFDSDRLAWHGPDRHRKNQQGNKGL